MEVFMGREQTTEQQRQAIPPEQLQQIQTLANTIRYGSITLVFQDGILIQIDKTEKFRMTHK